jgi:type I restriction enzyme S subunit
MSSIQLEPAYLRELHDILYRNIDTSRWKPIVFGSRVTGKARQTSDIDIGIIGNERLPIAIRQQLGEALDNSDIPYVVEVVDFKDTTAKFQEVALQETAVI